MKYQAQKPVQLVTRPTCLNCGQLLDGACAVHEGEPREHRPTAGDLTICICCGHIMAYADEGSFRELTDQEVRDAAGDERLLLIQKARRLHEQRTKALSGGVSPGDQADSGAAVIPSGGAGPNGLGEDLGSSYDSGGGPFEG